LMFLTQIPLSTQADNKVEKFVSKARKSFREKLASKDLISLFFSNSVLIIYLVTVIEECWKENFCNDLYEVFKTFS